METLLVQGWLEPSPYCNEIPAYCILDILGHVTGSRGRRVWADRTEQDIALKRIVTKWTKSVLRMKWKNKEEAWEIMDSTKYGPSFWTTLPGRVDPDLCILILEEIKGKLHGKQRQILRSHISEAVGSGKI